SQVFEEDIAFATTPNAERIFTHFIHTPRLFPLFNPHDTNTTLWAGAHTSCWAAGTQHRLVAIGATEHGCRILSHSRRAKPARVLSLLPGWYTGIATHRLRR